MCGICGIYGMNDRNLIERMCAKITHRGPDAEGFYFDAGLMLGMRRLKVIDLETGDQPVYNEDKTVVVINNGEIYNYREVRKDLQDAGHIFATNSDTEVMVHLYEEYGDGFVNKLRGMFACALWDTKKQRIVLARDRIGIKPLYYHFHNGILSFASELKSLLVCPKISKELNFSALHKYLTYTYVPAPETIFENIYKLMPGHRLVGVNGRIWTEQYWDLNKGDYTYNETQRMDENELSEQLSSLIKESVKMHLVSDVPLGVFLSGGTDSGTILDYASEATDTPVRTFSIGFDDDYYNELDNARIMSHKYETSHTEYVIKPQEMDYMETVLSTFDEPFADSSAIPAYFVSKHAKQHATVALSGDGGDEIFGGYGNYRADKITNYYRRLPSAVRDKLNPFIANKFSKNNSGVLAQIKKLAETSSFSPEYGHAFWLSVFSRGTKEKLYTHENLKSLLDVDPLAEYEDYSRHYYNGDFINGCMNIDMKRVLPDDYLTKVDRMSMLNSLEVRVPFIDHRLIEFAVTIPSRYKLKGLTSKYLLKRIMKGRLPDKILNGKKKGFSMPLNKWFKEDFSSLVDKYLSKKKIEQRGYFNYDAISAISSEHMSGRRDNSKFLWTLICFEIWHKEFLPGK